jgi:elongation factor G
MLVETALDEDDDLMEAYLEGNEPSIEDIKHCVRKGTIALNFFPTFCGSAFKNKGVQNVLNAVVDYLPNPTEVPPQPEIDLEGNATGGLAKVDAEYPLRALAFKIMDDRYGALTFTRIYSGRLKKGSSVLNTFTGKSERIGRIVEMHADSREELESAQAGDIVALLALNKMIQEDPSFRVETDDDSGETIIKGMGELHLDIKVDILKRTHGVEVEMGKPQVAYRETITQLVEDTYTHKKQSGGSGQYGRIDYIVEPGETGSGYQFESKVTGGNVPREYWSAIDKAFGQSMEEGTLAGFPLLDVKVTLMDGAYHAVDSSAMAFELAAKAAYRQTIPKASPQLLEPIMKETRRCQKCSAISGTCVR